MNHMTQLAKLIDREADYNFPIETIPMMGRADDDPSADVYCPDRIMIINEETGQYLGNHSKSYRPVTHAQVVDPVKSIVDSITKDYTTQIDLLENGAMMKATFICKDIKFDDPAMQDYICFRISVRNSYNGTWSVMITADGLRLWCLNGCTTADKIANYRQKHNGIFNYNFEHIKHSINLFRDNEDRYREWYNTPVNDDIAVSLFNKLTYTPKPTIDGKYRNETQFYTLISKWNEYRNNIGHNKWGLYNAVTDWISHPQNVSNPQKTIVERNSAFTKLLGTSKIFTEDTNGTSTVHN